MRAYTIILFILSVHACLAMMNTADITNSGLNISVDTTSKNGFYISQGHTNMTYLMSSDPRFFNESATGKDITSNATLTRKDYIGKFIESIFEVGGVFLKFMDMCTSLIFSIHTLCAPIFGEFNSWILEGIVDFAFGIALFQIVTGRSFKTME